MRITLNLATRPYADLGPALKQLRIGMAVLGVILIGLIFGLLHFHQAAVRMAAQEQALDQAVAKVRQEETGYQAQMQQPANARVLTQANFLNGLFDEKSFSWTETMEDLEPVLPGGVMITAIEPSRGKDGRLTLRLRISGPRDRSIEMVRNMERSARFVSPRLAGENAETSSNGQNDVQPVSTSNKVNFEILAEYSQATPEQRKIALAAAARAAQEKQSHTPPTAAKSAPRTGLPATANRTTNKPGAVLPPHPANARPVRPTMPGGAK